MIAESSMPDRRPSPNLSLELSSNNPFRNRASSPALQTPTSAGSRPMSRNPFVQTFEAEFNKQAQLIDMSANMKESPKKATFANTTEELFNNLTLDDGEQKRRPAPPRPSRSGTTPVTNHRPSRSDEEDRDRDRRSRDADDDRRRMRDRDDDRRRRDNDDDRRRRDDDDRRRVRGPPRGPPRPGGSGSRPRNSPDRRERRPRRNSESSMIDKGSLDPDEERRRRQRRRERDERSKDGKSRSGKVRKPHGLDVIDKLDVSGIYGPSMIHHDGPYDAVQPHRNRKKDHRAPMEAFPLGSANNALGGNGPVNNKIDLDRIHGRGAEGFTDFGQTEAQPWKKRTESDAPGTTYGPKDPEHIVHGDVSEGLGTSTFLDGAPASRAAIAQRESENQKALADGGGLGRKKSIAQRFRGISQPRRDMDGRPRITSPDARYGTRSPSGPLSTGGIQGSSKTTEANPFFDNYDEAYERKTTTIKIAESENREGAGSPASPSGRNPLTRAITSDGAASPRETKPQIGAGFLNRVKSLKGGRRPQRPERPAA
ncbi:unnamed protein product [Periconia digitata]|uniref:Pal1-domain-containing protein n=1 Tax=Periconia digitata TaxID=1303443 RepID=A0A9W4UDT4_9PLEO|nr:unnamed protein product [Periconia digitata]